MEIEDGSGKRGRGRGRGTRTRARGRGRGRGRGKKVAVVPCSDEETLMEQVFDGASTANLEDCEILASSNAANEDAVTQKVIEVDHVPPRTNANPTSTRNPTQPQTATNMRTQTIDMEADISQLEAPTFTTISRGPPEPMLRLKWSHKVSLIGEKVLNPMIHICDQCDKPILHYGRMIPCKHVFCLKCARTEPVKTCPRCNDKVVRVEQSGLGTVFMCTHSGSRYGNTGCRRTYLSQRDLQAHINHRHVTQPQHAPTLAGSSNELKMEINSQRKLSEVSAACTALQAPSTHLTQRSSLRPSAIQIGNIAPPGSTSTISSTLSSLTQANLARINNANAADCHQGKVALHQTLKKAPLTQSHHQPPEAVADASYYSSVLNSFGSTTPTNVTPGSTPQNVSSVQAPWQAQSYYR